ncbi:hypothetical protein [Planococcus sp. CAU13]|uniref:hypothetical protein n=1 Tax=Planococcus sp. CAU13 TaxID=1541197 RepID=UPI00052FF348|nr:hypothetical protein [Planococcus sp. CAU13]
MYRLKELLRRFAQNSDYGKKLWTFLVKMKQIVHNDRNFRRLPRNMTVAQFIEQLNRKGCRYVILRWFEDLPHVEYGGDIDLLVHDDDAAILDSILTWSPRKGGIPCDVYSVSGLPSYSFKEIAYYPPVVAQQLLERSAEHESGAKVPSENDYFYSLVFHALYHKGYESGLSEDGIQAPKVSDPGHDFQTVLAEMAKKQGVAVDINMKALDALLEEKGWKPTLDMLEKLGQDNEWCAKLANDILKDMPEVPGLAVFIIREAAASPADEQKVKEELEKHGFQLIRSKKLNGYEKQHAAQQLRGGNWGEKSSVLSGGLPATFVAAIDLDPIEPSIELKNKYPLLDNRRIADVKKDMREKFFKNIIHSSDSARQAAHYLETVMPDEMNEVLDAARKKLAKGQNAPAGVLLEKTMH